MMWLSLLSPAFDVVIVLLLFLRFLRGCIAALMDNLTSFLRSLESLAAAARAESTLVIRKRVREAR